MKFQIKLQIDIEELHIHQDTSTADVSIIANGGGWFNSKKYEGNKTMLFDGQITFPTHSQLNEFIGLFSVKRNLHKEKIILPIVQQAVEETMKEILNEPAERKNNGII